MHHYTLSTCYFVTYRDWFDHIDSFILCFPLAGCRIPAVSLNANRYERYYSSIEKRNRRAGLTLCNAASTKKILYGRLRCMKEKDFFSQNERSSCFSYLCKELEEGLEADADIEVNMVQCSDIYSVNQKKKKSPKRLPSWQGNQRSKPEYQSEERRNSQVQGKNTTKLKSRRRKDVWNIAQSQTTELQGTKWSTH